MPKISAYLTTYNCKDAGHPFLAAIESLLHFSHEVVVADGGSIDGTWESLCEVAEAHDRLKVLRYPIDRSRPSWALDVDLWLKAKARRACTGDVCLQMDADEIVLADDGRKFGCCIEYLSEETPLLALPRLEYWAGLRNVRRDLYPATPKLSLNLPNISHGLPRGFRAHDEHGLLYALPYAALASTYIDLETLEPVPCESLIPHEIETMRESARCEEFEELFYECLDDLPVLHHFAWVSIERKLRQLRDFWAHFHRSFYRIDGPISAWPLFDTNWDRVSDTDIEARARELERRGPSIISDETDFPTLMEAKKELPANIRELLAGQTATLTPASPKPIHGVDETEALASATATPGVRCLGFGAGTESLDPVAT